MHSIIQIQSLLLLALITFAIAAPATHNHVQKRSFKVARQPNPNFKGRTPGAGTRALVKAYRKFSVPLPPGLLDAMNAASAGAAGAGAGAAGGVKEDAGGLDALLGLLGDLGNGQDQPAAASAGADPKATKSAAPAATKSAKAKSAAPKATATKSAAGVNAPSAVPAPVKGNSTAAATNGTKNAGVVVNTPLNGDTEYISPVTIGGQTINMDFDSGSSDLWVFNQQLSAASTAGHQVFDSTKSTTFKAITGATFSISYGDGSGAAGNVGTDVVNIGGATVTGQAIEMATAVSASFVSDTGSNGLVGLAFSKLNTVKPTQQKTFFDNAMATLAEPVFTADLRHNANGAYEFGNIDATKFNGTMQWAPVNTTQGFWQFSSQKFAVAGGAVMSVAGGQAIADTGTTLMLANPAIVNAYYSTVTGAVNNATVGGVTFPCNAVLPDMQFDVGGAYMATVRGDDINFAPVDATNTSKLSSFSLCL